jgi:hypothetical protein
MEAASGAAVARREGLVAERRDAAESLSISRRFM